MSMDWDDVRRHLDAAAEAVALGGKPSATERLSILESRAHALAREPARIVAASESMEVVEFSLASEAYAIESVFIREVLPLKSYTPLPATPSFILGVVNARGHIISVVDLKKFFDLPEAGLCELDKVIVIGDDRMEFGILADAVIGARSIALADISPPIPTLSKVGAEYVKGIAEARVIVLDAKRILGDDSIVLCQEAD
jgi:purine-binding chemotaxis protein CheW